MVVMQQSAHQTSVPSNYLIICADNQVPNPQYSHKPSTKQSQALFLTKQCIQCCPHTPGSGIRNTTFSENLLVNISASPGTGLQIFGLFSGLPSLVYCMREHIQ